MTSSSNFAFSTPLQLQFHTSFTISSTSPIRKPRTSTITIAIPRAVQQQNRPSTTIQSKAQSSSSLVTDTNKLMAYLLHHKQIVDNVLESSLTTRDDRTSKIIEAMRYSLLAGGKRIRPILAIAAYQMFAPEGHDADLSPVLPAALAVEMIHTMSLIHDDLPSMDNDDFRRGKPTNHKVYGEDIAILAGDALLSYAFEYVSRYTVGVDPSRVLQVLSLLTNSVGVDGLVGGQVMDMQCEGQPDTPLDTLTWIHTHKTAALLRVSCACGAILGGANEEDVARVSEFAVKIGLAFQIADDVLDVTASTEELGKTAGKDEATDKSTYPRLLGLDGSRQHAKNLIAEAKQALAPYGERSDALFALADFIINRSN